MINFKSFLTSIKQQMGVETWVAAERCGIISMAELNMYEKELTGGKCEICKKEWKEKEHKYILQDGSILDSIKYFSPVCDCYPICVYCGRRMILEVRQNDPDCRYCFYDRVSQTWSLHRCYEKVQAKARNAETGRLHVLKRLVRCSGVLELRSRQGIYACSECGKSYKRSFYET